MSKMRQRPDLGDEALLVRSYAVTHPSNLGLSRRADPDWDQLAYASRGVMVVETAQGTWVVPPLRAVWIPAGVAYSVRMSGRVSVRTLFFRPRLRGPERVAAGAGAGPARLPPQHAAARRARRPTPGAPHPRPAGHPARRAAPAPPALRRPCPQGAELLQASPSEPAALDNITRPAGASKRTLERVFLRETGLTLGRWRRRLRFASALRLLAEGHAVTSVAVDVGYASPSAFVSAFRRELGTTPGRYFAESQSSAAPAQGTSAYTRTRTKAAT